MLNKNSYCLTVNDQKYKKLCENFQMCGINIPFKFKGRNFDNTFFKNFCKRDLQYLCSIGHLDILFSTICSELDYCIIFEEDAYCLYNNMTSIFNDIIDSMKCVDWNIILFGYDGVYLDQCPYYYDGFNVSYVDYIKKLKNKINLETDFCYTLDSINVSGSQAYIINKKYYSNLMLKIIQKKEPIDKILMSCEKCYLTKKTYFSQYQLYDNTHLLPYYMNEEYDIGPITKINL